MDIKNNKSRTAVIIPCYNEALTIGKVIRDFQKVLPGADIFVVDNNCTDDTASIAQEAGAFVITESRKGKGHALNCIPNVVETDYYVVVDGDDTYPAEATVEMLKIVKSGQADIVVGNRQPTYQSTKVRPFHGIGNKLVRWLINVLFDASIRDPLSGLRVLSRKAALTLPFMVGGFDVETEMTVQSLLRKLIVHEVDIEYSDRPEENPSKLNTYSDGYRILVRIFMMLMVFKPLTFCVFFSGGIMSVGLSLGIFLFYAQTVPDMIFLAAFMVIFIISGFVLFFFGVTIHIVNNRITETQKFVIRPAIADLRKEWHM